MHPSLVPLSFFLSFADDPVLTICKLNRGARYLLETIAVLNVRFEFPPSMINCQIFSRRTCVYACSIVKNIKFTVHHSKPYLGGCPVYQEMCRFSFLECWYYKSEFLQHTSSNSVFWNLSPSTILGGCCSMILSLKYHKIILLWYQIRKIIKHDFSFFSLVFFFFFFFILFFFSNEINNKFSNLIFYNYF